MGYDILLFPASLEGGGAERVMVTLANAFTERGLKVGLVIIKGGEGYRKELHKDVPVIDLRTQQVWRSILPLARLLKREKPRAFFSTLMEANIGACLASRLVRFQGKVVIREANTPSQHLKKRTFKRWLTRKVVRQGYLLADEIVAVSSGVRRDLAQLLRVPEERIHLIFNPSVSERVIEASYAEVEHSWFADKSVPVVLGVGRLSPQKGFSVLIRAFRIVRETLPARLVILGEGPQRAELELLVEQLGLQDVVHLPGFNPNPYRYMRRASVFVLSSEYEGLPNVLIQALACGCPVVSTDCPSGPEDILDGGKYGELVPVGDIEAMANAILRVLRGERKQVPTEWLEQFREDVVVEQYLRILF